MRFLTCEPNLSKTPNYTDEADIFFYTDSEKWLKKTYSDTSKLPTHLVMFNALIPNTGTFLNDNKYRKCATFFHTHVPEGRVGSHVIVFCRKMESKPRRGKQLKATLFPNR